ncbi:porin family protein [Hymenobacter ruber]
MKSFQLLATAIAAAGAFQSGTVQAQVRVSIGPQLGVNISSTPYATHYRPDGFHTAARIGIEVGAVASVSTGHWALQPALLFSQRGFKIDDEYTQESNGYYSWNSTKNDYCFNYLTLPLSLAYLQRADGQGLQAFAGPYLSLLLGGHYTSTLGYSYRTPHSGGGNSSQTSGAVVAYANPWPNTVNNDVFYTQRFDAGVQGGLGYGYGRALLHIGYSLGLRNLGKEYTVSGNAGSATISASIYHNSAFQATLAYWLFAKP